LTVPCSRIPGNLLVAADLDHGRFDASLGQQVGEHQAGGAGSHDGHLGGDDFACCHGLSRFNVGPAGAVDDFAVSGATSNGRYAFPFIGDAAVVFP
jgi:hypothetical protein